MALHSYPPKKGLVLHSSGWWYIWQISTSSQHWVGTHLGHPCWPEHGSGWVCPGSAGRRSGDWGYLTWIPVSWHTCRVHLDWHPQAAVAIPPGSNPPCRGKVYCLVPEVILTRPEVFLELPDMSGLWPCAWIHIKIGLGPHTSSRWDEGQIPTLSQQSSLIVRKYTSICCTNSIILYVFFGYSIHLFNLLSLLCLLSGP